MDHTKARVDHFEAQLDACDEWRAWMIRILRAPQSA